MKTAGPTDVPPGAVLPAKRFGQHFLTDQSIIHRIITALAPQRDETVVEIGPGKGALTAHLIQRAGSVVAVELDRRLTPFLQEQFGSHQNFKLIESDALTLDLCKAILPATKARLVANLPYNISTAILQRLIEQRDCLTELVLMLQREVVDRMTAAPGSSERGYLSLIVEAYTETEKLFDVAPGSFRPPPKVWSSVVRVRFRRELEFDGTSEGLFWRIVSAGFVQRRKTILNNLRSAPEPLAELLKRYGGASIVLCRAEIELTRRAETLSLTEWGRIARALE